MNALRILYLACALALLSGCASTGAEVPEIKVALSGALAVPPNASTASGTGRFWIHRDRTLNGIVETSGMQGTAAYIAVGPRKVAGPPAVTLERTSSVGPLAMEHMPVSGASWSVPRGARFTEEQYQAFLAGETYVVVHSGRYPLGEIRGQLVP